MNEPFHLPMRDYPAERLKNRKGPPTEGTMVKSMVSFVLHPADFMNLWQEPKAKLTQPGDEIRQQSTPATKPA